MDGFPKMLINGHLRRLIELPQLKKHYEVSAVTSVAMAPEISINEAFGV
jgi:hypothetical protein